MKVLGAVIKAGFVVLVLLVGNGVDTQQIIKSAFVSFPQRALQQPILKLQFRCIARGGVFVLCNDRVCRSQKKQGGQPCYKSLEREVIDSRPGRFDFLLITYLGARTSKSKSEGPNSIARFTANTRTKRAVTGANEIDSEPPSLWFVV